MSIFQLILLVLAVTIFYTFYKQLLSGNHPKRGIDFEQKIDEKHLGNMAEPAKLFAKSLPKSGRVQELISMADDAIANKQWDVASRALQSAAIIEPDQTYILSRIGYIALEQGENQEAVDVYSKVIEINPEDDLAHVSMANALQKLGRSQDAVGHHKKSIEIDGAYAPHYYNYANTLYEIGDKTGALDNYKKAIELDGDLQSANDMIKKLEERV